VHGLSPRQPIALVDSMFMESEPQPPCLMAFCQSRNHVTGYQFSEGQLLLLNYPIMSPKIGALRVGTGAGWIDMEEMLLSPQSLSLGLPRSKDDNFSRFGLSVSILSPAV
jgi:hypothetical protein